MSSESENHQNEMLNRVRKERKRVSVYLVNGIKLVGHVESFDQYLVMLSSASGVQAVYKHAISTIQEDTGAVRRTGDTQANSGANAGAPQAADGKQTVAVSYRRRPVTDSRD